MGVIVLLPRLLQRASVGARHAEDRPSHDRRQLGLLGVAVEDARRGGPARELRREQRDLLHSHHVPHQLLLTVVRERVRGKPVAKDAPLAAPA